MGAAYGVVLPSVAVAGLLACISTGRKGPLSTFGQMCLGTLLEFCVPFLRSAVGFEMATLRPSLRFSAVVAGLLRL